MKTNITKIGVALLAVGFCLWSTAAWAQTQTQTSTTVTTTKGAFSEYVPGSETVVVKTERDPAPLRYVVTKQTTVVDESGAPVAIERVPAGSQLSVQYAGNGDRLVASRIVVQKPVTSTTVTAPVTSGPVTTAPVATQDTTTTTTTTRPLTHEEKHAQHEEREHRKKAAKEEIHKQKEALEKAEDKLDDDN
jgi:hypothetical protein